MRAYSPAWLVLGAAAAVRLWLAAVMPLTDTTEARFGEMARKMVETGSWLVPQHDYGVPYLAKPPLAMWASAAGIALFGHGELAPRLLILAATLGFCVLLYRCARRWLGAAAAVTTLLVLGTSLLFFVSAGTVMTDMLLTVCVGAALLAFFERWRGGTPLAEVGLYAAVGLGLLVKGPLAAVLVGVPIVVWSIALGRSREVWRRFAWLRGGLLALAIAAPWYAAAELRTPGFLRYFIVGEHLQRFLVPAWGGDLYGRAHDVPQGAALVFFAFAALPWIVLAPLLLWKDRAHVAARFRDQRELIVLLLAASATPLALFAFAGNVIWPYVLPSLPPAALAFAAVLRESAATASPRPVLVRVAAAAIAATVVAALLAAPFIDAHSQRAVVRAAGSTPLYYWQRRYFSADYYSRGRARVIHGSGEIDSELSAHRPFLLVVEESDLVRLPSELTESLRPATRVGPMVLLEPRYGPAVGS
jgi:4-amino-4-deoxy-L-arabinose transferase-like glycosyltransferase